VFVTVRWAQEKLDARRILENGDVPSCPVPRGMMTGDPFMRENQGCDCAKYTPNWQAYKPYKAMESIMNDSHGAPWFSVKLI